MERRSILAVDDDADVRELLAAILRRAGYDLETAADGRAGLRAFHARPPDLVILDVAMPGLDGWQTLERIRDLSDVPVMMLTAQTQELEKVRGLQAGADDYVTKPFGKQELVARIDALLRRTRPERPTSEAYADAVLTVDFAQRAVRVEGTDVTLTPLEFRLLAAFVRHAGQVLSREQLLEQAWGGRYVADEQVKLYVGYLRRKLAGAGADGAIETVRGFGYRYRRPA